MTEGPPTSNSEAPASPPPSPPTAPPSAPPDQGTAPPPHGRWGPPEQRVRIWPWLLLGLVVVVIVVGAVLAYQPGIFGELAALTRAGAVPVNALREGDCYEGTLAGGDESILALSVQRVDCAEPHAAEVVGRFSIEGELGSQVLYPGDEAVTVAAQEGCLERFAAYVGTEYAVSELDLQYYYPLRRSWMEGDRIVACSALEPDGERLEGTVRGSGR